MDPLRLSAINDSLAPKSKSKPNPNSASEMTYIVSVWALNLTHSLLTLTIH